MPVEVFSFLSCLAVMCMEIIGGDEGESTVADARWVLRTGGGLDERGRCVDGCR